MEFFRDKRERSVLNPGGADIKWNSPKFLGLGPGRCLLIQMYFCKGYEYGEKVDLSKGYWNPKRKLWVTTHFSETINQP